MLKIFIVGIQQYDCNVSISISKKAQSHDVAVVVSAMSGETDRLISLAKQITPAPDAREYDQLVSTGECVSAALLSLLMWI